MTDPPPIEPDRQNPFTKGGHMNPTQAASYIGNIQKSDKQDGLDEILNGYGAHLTGYALAPELELEQAKAKIEKHYKEKIRQALPLGYEPKLEANDIMAFKAGYNEAIKDIKGNLGL